MFLCACGLGSRSGSRGSGGGRGGGFEDYNILLALDLSPGEDNIAAVYIVSIGIIDVVLRGIDLLELVSLEGIADDLSHLGSIEGNSCFHNKLGTVAEVLENARNETG